jgi:HSP20 family molecular chaperone IbpA
MSKENENQKNREEFDETVNNLKEFGNGLFNTLNEMSEEILGEDFTKIMKEKSSNVQTKVQETVHNMKDKVSDYKTDLKTETIIPNVSDEAYEIKLSLAGLPKSEKRISLVVEDELLIIEINSEGIEPSVKKYWSVSKDRLVLDLSDIDDYKTSKIKAKHEDGIFTVTIPRIAKEVKKTEINID